ncbi:centrosomal protein of 152 kDa-like [Macrobrachium nipponense]|uniref:centrosomal protein of 152 kDa-like n=1 Tax=Macrobrachium nipponense TaxID=159736 RepID=UPI0030C8921B
MMKIMMMMMMISVIINLREYNNKKKNLKIVTLAFCFPVLSCMLLIDNEDNDAEIRDENSEYLSDIEINETNIVQAINEIKNGAAAGPDVCFVTCIVLILQVMDNPGHSLFVGGSIHLDSIRPPDPDDDEEDEEEKRQREAEIQGMLANAFDDLEEEDSFANTHSRYSAVSNRSHGYGNSHPDTPRPVHPLQYTNDYPGNAAEREVMNDESYAMNNCSTQSHGGESHPSDSRSQTPWSDESNDHSNRFKSLSYQETARDSFLYTNGEDGSNNQRHLFLGQRGENDCETPVYDAQNLKSGDGVSHSEEFRIAEGSYEQLKLLYEARGRELDNLTAELSKVKSEKLREVRILQHQLSLVTAECETKKSNFNHCQILLSEKEEMVRKLKLEVVDLEKKNQEIDSANKKIKVELEVAESVVSSLECQVSQLRAADCLSKNQQLHEDFVKKLRQGNQEERDLLMNKIQSLQKESDTHQREAQTLRDELKSMRKIHDDLLVEKTETTTRLTVTIRTLQNQYEDLLQSHDSHKIIDLQLRNKSLESEKGQLGERVKMLEAELEKAKEEIKGYDSAVMIGLFSDAMPGVEDSMSILGIKKTLNYDDTTREEPKKLPKEPLNEAQLIVKMKDELKRSLAANKTKRDAIARLQEDIREKQNQLRKVQSDLKSSQTETKELKEELLKLKFKESETTERNQKESNDVDLKNAKAENISLKQELITLYVAFGDMKKQAVEFSNFVISLSAKLDGNLVEVPDNFTGYCNKLLKTAEKYVDLVTDFEQHQKIISDLREKVSKLQEESGVWEQRVRAIEAKVTASLKMIKTALIDESKASEYTHALHILQKLLEEIKQQVEIMTENSFNIQGKNIYLEDKLRTVELEVEKQRQEMARLTEEKESFREEMTTLSKKKDEEKALALQSCQDTYLKFHEDAVKELEVRFNAEYENTGAKLKQEISRLAEELSNVKGLYLNVCEERNELEEQLKKQIGSVNNISTSEATNTAGQGKPLELSSSHSVEDIRLYKKRIECLEGELENVRLKHDEDMKRFVAEKKQLSELYQMKTNDKEMSNETSLKELKEKCSALENANSILKEKIKHWEDVSPVLNSNSDVGENALPRGHEKCQELLKMQRSRFDAEREELQSQFQKELGDLKDRLRVSNELRAKEVEAVNFHKDALQEQEKIMKSLRDDLATQREGVKIRDQESEQEVRKLTDMIMNLESEAREQQEEFNEIKAKLQKELQNRISDEHFMKQKIKLLEEAAASSKLVSAKYDSLRRKFKEYHKASEHQREFQKCEINRLDEEFVTFKETWIKRVKDFVERAKKRFSASSESTISELKKCELELTYDRIYRVRLKVEEDLKAILNMSVKWEVSTKVVQLESLLASKSSTIRDSPSISSARVSPHLTYVRPPRPCPFTAVWSHLLRYSMAVSTVQDLSSLEDAFNQKMSALQIMSDIRGHWGGDTVDEFEALKKELQLMHQEVSLQKKVIAQGRSDVKAAFSLLEQIQQLSSVVSHMQENLPGHLPQTGKNQCGVSKNNKSDKEKDAGKSTSQEKAPVKGNSGKSKQIPSIQYITVEEFDGVSKYIKGRLLYEQVNNAVDEVNKAIETKYSLMARPRAKLSEFDMKIVTAFKLQENKETKGFYFVVDNDIKRWSNLKLDPAGRSMLTVLRTLKRLREIRGPGSLIRYAVS